MVRTLSREKAVKTVGKHKFYEINAADEIMLSRFMIAEIQEIYIRYGISEAFLSEIAELLIKKGTSTGDIKADMVAIGLNLRHRVGAIAEKKMYEELACVYFLMDDEPAEYEQQWQEKKKALWRAHPKERDFFITEAFKRTNASQHISMKDILAVLEAADERLFQLPSLSGL